MIFNFDSLMPTELAIVRHALDNTNFDFDLLKPGLISQTGRDYIPVLFSDLSRWQMRLDAGMMPHSHPASEHHDHESPHTITRIVSGRNRVLGLAWYSGKVEIERTCPPNLAAEVFLAEGAHMVDFFYMTPKMREDIFNIYHNGESVKHDHGWFEETGNDDYWSWVGESFMYGFMAAFSRIPFTGDAFHHRTTTEIGRKIFEVFNPPDEVARNKRSSIVHRMRSWHEQQIPDGNQENIKTLKYALGKGYRACKTCRW
jgi:hypothetical protein